MSPKQPDGDRPPPQLLLMPSGPAHAYSEEFAEFYTLEHDGQVRRAFLLLGNAAAAHDVVAEAFVAVLARWDGIDEPGPYLNRCVLNGCRDQQRRGPREEPRSDPLVEEADPADHNVGHDEADELAELLLELPFRQRAAIVLRYYGGYRENDIAIQLECRPGTVGSLIHRGLRSLRDGLDQPGGDVR